MTSSSHPRRRAGVEVSDAEIEAAYRRHEERLATEPLAVTSATIVEVIRS
jgi:hypothetical protein